MTMDDKCTHETSFVDAMYGGFSLLRCTWACGQELIELDLGNHTVATYTAADLLALRDLLAAVRETRHMGSFAVPAHIKAALELYEEQTKGATS
jgi:hypothetical protein